MLKKITVAVKAALIAIAALMALSEVALANPFSSVDGSCRLGEIRKSNAPIQTVIRFDRIYFAFQLDGSASIVQEARMLDSNNLIAKMPLRIQFKNLDHLHHPYGMREMEAWVYNRFTDRLEYIRLVSGEHFEYTWHAPNVANAKPGDAIGIWLLCYLDPQNDTGGVDLDDFVQSAARIY